MTARRYAHQNPVRHAIAAAMFFGGWAVIRANYRIQKAIKNEVVTRWANDTHQGD